MSEIDTLSRLDRWIIERLLQPADRQLAREGMDGVPIATGVLSGKPHPTDKPVLRNFGIDRHGDSYLFHRDLPRPVERLAHSAGVARMILALEFPDIRVYENVISSEECDYIRGLAFSSLSRSTVVSTSSGVSSSVVDEVRTSFGATLSDADPTVDLINSRIEKLLRWPRRRSEDLHVLRYGRGGEYQPHYDFFPPEALSGSSLVSVEANRVATFIMYLEDCENGGETIFPDIGLRMKARKGYGIYFSYAFAHPSTLTLHGGAPVAEEEKWIATRWLIE